MNDSIQLPALSYVEAAAYDIRERLRDAWTCECWRRSILRGLQSHAFRRVCIRDDSRLFFERVQRVQRLLLCYCF